MASSNVNVGIEGRSSSRVLKPPGGGHTDIFGKQEKVEVTQSRYSQQSQKSSISECFGYGSSAAVKQQPIQEEMKEISKIEEIAHENGVKNGITPVPEEVKTKPVADVPSVASQRVRVPPGGFSSGLCFQSAITEKMGSVKSRELTSSECFGYYSSPAGQNNAENARNILRMTQEKVVTMARIPKSTISQCFEYYSSAAVSNEASSRNILETQEKAVANIPQPQKSTISECFVNISTLSQWKQEGNSEEIDDSIKKSWLKNDTPKANENIEPQDNKTPVTQQLRVPPGGFSSILW